MRVSIFTFLGAPIVCVTCVRSALDVDELVSGNFSIVDAEVDIDGPVDAQTAEEFEEDQGNESIAGSVHKMVQRACILDVAADFSMAAPVFLWPNDLLRAPLNDTLNKLWGADDGAQQDIKREALKELRLRKFSLRKAQGYCSRMYLRPLKRAVEECMIDFAKRRVTRVRFPWNREKPLTSPSLDLTRMEGMLRGYFTAEREFSVMKVMTLNRMLVRFRSKQWRAKESEKRRLFRAIRGVGYSIHGTRAFCQRSNEKVTFGSSEAAVKRISQELRPKFRKRKGICYGSCPEGTIPTPKTKFNGYRFRKWMTRAISPFLQVCPVALAGTFVGAALAENLLGGCASADLGCAMSFLLTIVLCFAIFPTLLISSLVSAVASVPWGCQCEFIHCGRTEESGDSCKLANSGLTYPGHKCAKSSSGACGLATCAPEDYLPNLNSSALPNMHGTFGQQPSGMYNCLSLDGSVTESLPNLMQIPSIGTGSSEAANSPSNRQILYELLGQ